MHRLLRDELSRRFVAAGWAIDPAQYTEPGQPRVATFRRQFADDFFASADYLSDELGSLQDSELAVRGFMGVSYEPAYRLWPLLCDIEQSDYEIHVSDFLGHSDMWDVRISGASGVPRAAETLATPILEHGVEWASQYTSVEALLEAIRSDPDWVYSESKVIPVILAGTGRLEEARSALETYVISDREEVHTKDYKNFAYRLNRWLDAGGVLPDRPTEPLGERYQRDPVSEEEHVQESRENYDSYLDERQERQQAVEAVRAQSTGKDRNQLKEMLKAELADRGQVQVRPLYLENMLDRINPPSLSLTKQVELGVRGLLGIGAEFHRLFRRGDHQQPAPEWMVPPGRAAYKAHRKWGSYVEVRLDPSKVEFLERVFAAAPSREFNTVKDLDIWLTWDPESRTSHSQLAVHIGDQRVGDLEPADVEIYRADMDAAATREELPYVGAILTRRRFEPIFVLELNASPIE